MPYFTPTDIPAFGRARSDVLDDNFNKIKSAFDSLPTETELKTYTGNYGTDSGAADVYVITLPYAPAAYADGMEIVFTPANNNTGASTVNVNSLGVKSIVRQDETELQANDIAGIVTLRYNATIGKFMTMNAIQGQALSALMASLNAAADSYAAMGVLSGVQHVTDLSSLRGINPVAGRVIYARNHTDGVSGGGGNFEALTTGGPYTDDDGITIVPTGGDGSVCWRRKLDGFVTPEMFGYQGAGNDIAATLATLDDFADGVEILVSESTAIDAQVNRANIRGKYKSTNITAGTGATSVLHLGRHTPDWSYRKISNITIDGNSKASVGVDFEHDVVSSEHLGGRWSFEAVDFTNSSIGAYHLSGNIGNRYRDCNFKGNDVGLKMYNDPVFVMHTGATLIEGCEFSSNALAAIYVDDAQDGYGQFVVRDTVIEGNPGFGLFLNANSTTPFTGIVLDNVWFEANHTSGSVTIDSVSYTPKDMRFENTKPVNIRSSYLKSMELVNSTVIAEGCRIDDATGSVDITVDADSQLICENLYANGQVGAVPFVRSIASQAKVQSGTTGSYSVRGPLKSVPSRTHATTVYQNNFDGAGPWGFVGTASVNATSVSDGVVHNTCAELTIPTGYTLLGPDTGTHTAGKWAVWGIHAKLVSGSLATADLGGGGTKVGNIYLSTGEWVCSYGLVEIGGTPSASRMRFINSSGSDAVIRFADMFVIEFDTEEEALEFCNSGKIVASENELDGTTTWNPASLADGAGETSASITVTGAALGDFVMVAAPYDLQGITCNGYVDAANSVKIRLQNETGGAIDLASGTWRVRVIKV